VAVPRRRISRSNTRHPRATRTATAADLRPVTLDCRRVTVARHLPRAAAERKVVLP
jgi:ribosomal protein L32